MRKARSRCRYDDRYHGHGSRAPVQPFQMIVDRPFFCVIEDRRSGALLFVGAIYDPAA